MTSDPEPVAVLAAAFDVLGDEGTDGLGAEEAPIQRRSVEEDVAQLVLELVPEPAADGDAEAHLAAGPDRPGEQVGEGLLEHDLGAARAEPELAVQGHRRGQLDDPVVQERPPALQAVGHARHVHLCQEVAGQIRQEVADHGLGDPVAAAGQRRRPAPGPRPGRSRPGRAGATRPSPAGRAGRRSRASAGRPRRRSSSSPGSAPPAGSLIRSKSRSSAAEPGLRLSPSAAGRGSSVPPIQRRGPAGRRWKSSVKARAR